MAGETIERARGRWRELLPRLGVSPQHLSNKHGPCPVCGGRDRFRWDDRDGSGSFYCNQCGPGTGIVLVQRVNGWTFREAACEIDKLIGQAPPLPPQQTQPADDTGRRRAAVERVLREATDRRVVTDYLVSRGLRTIPAPLRGHTAMPYYDANGQMVGRFPAVVAPVHGPDGTLQSAHRIYVGDVSPRKKLMRPIDTVKGGAIRLFDVADTVGIAEGVETAVACYERDLVPTWAALSATILEQFQPPEGVTTVIVYGDHDLNFAGQRSAYLLASRLVREGYMVEVEIPTVPGDWLDIHAATEVAHAV